jgi:hypothetical protein
MPRAAADPVMRILKHAKATPNGCVEWTGTRNKAGYGVMGIGHRGHELVHRVAYRILAAPIPKGLCVLHKCDNPPCLLPEHLFLGTKKDNQQDMSKKGRHWAQRVTHCPRGHPYSGSNLYSYSYSYPKGTQRFCKECQREAGRRYRARIKAANG